MAVTIYTRAYCSYCLRAKRLLDELGTRYQEIPVDRDPVALQRMYDLSGRRTVPQIWIGPAHVGGFDDLVSLHRRGELLPLLNGSAAG